MLAVSPEPDAGIGTGTGMWQAHHARMLSPSPDNRNCPEHARRPVHENRPPPFFVMM